MTRIQTVSVVVFCTPVLVRGAGASEGCFVFTEYLEGLHIFVISYIWSPQGITNSCKTMAISVWGLLLTITITVQGQPQLACESVGDGSPVCSCGSGRVSCKDADLTHVPTDIPPDTETLELSGNKITSLPAMVFDGLPQLSTLDLSNNKISSIEVGAFDGLGGSLKNLKLNNNELVSLKEGIFRNLTTLEYLYLKDNMISTLRSGVFRGLLNVFKISFDGNSISSFPADIFSDVPPLRTVELPRNRIKSLEDILPALPSNMISLDLSGNNLGNLPAGAFNGFPRLSSLHLSSCNISDLPQDVFLGLSSLAYLYLNDNDLVELRNSSFGTHRRLAIVNFSNNKIARIEEGLFSRFPRLANIALQSNQLTSLPPRVFDNLSRMREIRLEKNKLESLDDASIFKDLQSIWIIYLHENNIKSLPSGIFSEANLPNLKLLTLYYNSLTVIENGTFDNLPRIQSIDLQHNPLEQVGCGMVPSKDKSASLQRLTISCTCHLKPLYDCPGFDDWLGEKTKCVFPIGVGRVKLKGVSRDKLVCSRAGANRTDWIALAILLLLSNLFIST
ncbi:PREDICTED: carboxypeptidase N subunit 2-like [Branchiostoma belcheri]|uniref:Carboxypeptidase N subunit 2-like n=1 Tax=Branchiostoma belcheri TaxID=7741 RepID=A0A6P4ZKY3_BRABE|nr:PREDICTED: carboxypeptidase N subunit 2-like [Branchiostoma belcheri]